MVWLRSGRSALTAELVCTEKWPRVVPLAISAATVVQ
jgi:hypothetical protein